MDPRLETETYKDFVIDAYSYEGGFHARGRRKDGMRFIIDRHFREHFDTMQCPDIASAIENAKLIADSTSVEKTEKASEHADLSGSALWQRVAKAVRVLVRIEPGDSAIH